MFQRYKNWQERRVVAGSPYKLRQWESIAGELPLLDRLDGLQFERLVRLATLFLHDKTFTGGSGFRITDDVRQVIALQACLPILNLGLDWYAGWSNLIVYEDAFQHEEDFVDEFGVTHVGVSELSGEAWVQGPVILSWADILDDINDDGYNVIIHEVAHKLDMLNGRANGYPPMPKGLEPSLWTDRMSAAYEDLVENPKPGIDTYAASDPAEFFAVLSELFFEAPEIIVDAWPAVYELLTRFYAQSPYGKYN